MTLEYESEILYKLMERDGFNIPSSVPPYESEIKAYLINQVQQGYPKLMDYEAEWLLYNYTIHMPADFPISSVSDVTEATFENVVPFAYQSAILKGNTLVNLGVNTNGKLLTPTDINYDVTCSYLEVGKSYYVIVKTNSTSQSGIRCGFVNNAGTSWDDTNNYVDYSNNKIVGKKHTLVKNKDSKFRIQLKGSNGNTTSEVNNLIEYVLILEYQDGMENWDIPYFEGMQSVKAPVLKGTGKNLFDKNCVVMDYMVFNDGRIGASKGNGVTDFIKVSKGKTYVKNNGNASLGVYSSSKTFIKRVSSTNTYTPSDDGYIRWNISAIKDVIDTLQIEEGSVATSYESFKSNILTVNEEVTLRGIGDIRDELDCLTGELTERIGEVLLDGSQQVTKWHNTTEQSNTLSWNITIDDMSYNSNILSDKLQKMNTTADVDNADKEVVATSSNNSLYIRLNKSRGLTEIDVMNNLAQNPITIQYQLASPTVKTVELTTVNEKGESVDFIPIEGTMNVQSSGEIIQPTFDMSVPVEAITQNLSSFIELEME